MGVGDGKILGLVLSQTGDLDLSVKTTSEKLSVTGRTLASNEIKLLHRL